MLKLCCGNRSSACGSLGYLCVCVYVCAHTSMCVRTCVRACMRVCSSISGSLGFATPLASRSSQPSLPTSWWKVLWGWPMSGWGTQGPRLNDYFVFACWNSLTINVFVCWTRVLHWPLRFHIISQALPPLASRSLRWFCTQMRQMNIAAQSTAQCWEREGNIKCYCYLQIGFFYRWTWFVRFSEL